MGGPNIGVELGFLDSDGVNRDVKGDGTSGTGDNLGIYILNKVWNPGTLEWERMKQPLLELTGDLTVTMGDLELLLANQYYKRMKPYAHASGRIKYICRNTDIDALETATDWFCWKYTDASPPESEGPVQGAVDAEATVDGLSWNI